MNAADIESQFQDRGEVRGGILMLRPRDAIALVAAAKEHDIRVLGIDAFRLSAEGTQPHMEHSLDLGSDSGGHSEQSWARASEFLERYAGSDFWFEVVLD